MTTLSVYSTVVVNSHTMTTSQSEDIRATLAHVGVDFERWETEDEVTSKDSPERILAAYDGRIQDQMRRAGYAVADVIAVSPDHPERVAIREKFLEEHIHTEDEARFFVAGRGAFYLHTNEQVVVVTCERGDFLRVPARMRHWFDMGATPNLVAIRMFTNPEGWVPQFTGDRIVLSIPRLEAGGLPGA